MNKSSMVYEGDFYGWIYHHIALLKQGQWADIDIEVLIEELEAQLPLELSKTSVTLKMLKC